MWFPLSHKVVGASYHETRCLTFAPVRECYRAGTLTETHNFFGNKVPTVTSSFWYCEGWSKDEATIGHNAAILKLFAGVVAVAAFAFMVYSAWGTFT